MKAEEGHLDLAADNGAVSNEVKSRLTSRDKAPTTKAASSRWVAWDALSTTLGQPFDNTNIPLSKLEQMRRDPMIAFGLMFCKVPLVRSQWVIKCERADIAAFIDAELRKVWGRLVLSLCNDMDYGFSPVVKRFTYDRPETMYIDKTGGKPEEKKAWDKDIDAIVWKPFFPLDPRKSEPAWNKAGEFAGINYRDIKGPTPKVSGLPADVPLDYALWATNEKDSVFGSIWGYPRTGYAYRFWWSYWYKFALSDRAFERFADPALLVYHPQSGIDPETGQPVDYQDKALDIGTSARSGDTVAVPNSMVMGLDDRSSNMREWEIKPLEGDPKFDALNQAFEYLDVQKLRALMVPEQALIEGKGGTSSRNVAATFGAAFQESMSVKMAEITDQVNRYVIPQLKDLNFGADAPRAELVAKGFDQEDIETMREIVRLVGQVSPQELNADIPAILDRLGVPRKTFEEVQRQLEEAARIAQETLPPPTSQEDIGEGAPVNEQGLYETPQEVIWLSELPKTRQYSDPEIMREADFIRALWQDELRRMYAHFADYVERGLPPLLLSEDAIMLATNPGKTLVARWRYSLAGAKDAMEGAFYRVMQRAAGRELQSFGLTQFNFSMDNQDVRDWMAKRGAFLIRKVASTVRQEMRDFLTDRLKEEKDPVDIAKDIRAHFSQFPDWKADRIARTEIRDAYNAATLLGYKSANVQMVQAYDGGGGITGETDAECLARNGQIFTLNDAMQEDEHPNGTLGWRPVWPGNFSAQVVPQAELPEEGAISYWEESTGTLYMAEGLGAEERQEILLKLGDELCKGGDDG
jgi:SPP1 gp7 family putative phage head morphogenesis protein